jgi:uncharacterized DUF497 family protein
MDDFILKNCLGFEWDKGNRAKNWKKHTVSEWECEQIFFNKPFLLYEDVKHSLLEKRWYALGKTDVNRKLFIVFTMRNRLIRVISARDASKREKLVYEEA